MSERRSPEAQFQLANERTYLAWLRTALALVASGVAAARLLAGQTLPWAWETVGVLLILAGVVTAALARRRWRAMNAAIREGEPLPAPGIAVMIAAVIVLCGSSPPRFCSERTPDTFHDRLGSFHPTQSRRSASRSIPTSTARRVRSSSQSISSSAKVRLCG